MVQYVTTPWRDRRELLAVRAQLFPSRVAQPPSACGQQRRRGRQQRRGQHQAVARVAMWVQRGNCPHLVESTALLAAAILGDRERGGGHAAGDGPDGEGAEEGEEEGESRDEEDDEDNNQKSEKPTKSRRTGHGGGGVEASSSSYASRAAYAAAFSRFVTGLLDSHQRGQHKLSMYAVAKNIGLPATFVELRHQSTHEQLPSLPRLRRAAELALDWIWGFCWAHLADGAAATADAAACTVLLSEAEHCRAAVLRVLREGRGTERVAADGRSLAGVWGVEPVLRALEDAMAGCVGGGAEGNGEGGNGTVTPAMVLKALRLEKALLLGRDEQMVVPAAAAGAGNAKRQIVEEVARARAELEGAVGAAEAEMPGDDEAAEEPGAGAGAGGELGWSLCGNGWQPKPIGVV